MSEPRIKQVEIYPHNVKKADDIARALNMSTTEAVNYLLDAFALEQVTALRLTDPATKRTVAVTRRVMIGRSERDYKP